MTRVLVHFSNSSVKCVHCGWTGNMKGYYYLDSKTDEGRNVEFRCPKCGYVQNVSANGVRPPLTENPELIEPLNAVCLKEESERISKEVSKKLGVETLRTLQGIYDAGVANLEFINDAIILLNDEGNFIERKGVFRVESHFKIAQELGHRIVEELGLETAKALLKKYGAYAITEVKRENLPAFNKDAYRLLSRFYKIAKIGNEIKIYKKEPLGSKLENVVLSTESTQPATFSSDPNLEFIEGEIKIIEEARAEISILEGKILQAERNLDALGLCLLDVNVLLGKRKTYTSKRVHKELMENVNKLMESLNDRRST